MESGAESAKRASAPRGRSQGTSSLKPAPLKDASRLAPALMKIPNRTKRKRPFSTPKRNEKGRASAGTSSMTESMTEKPAPPEGEDAGPMRMPAAHLPAA